MKAISSFEKRPSISLIPPIPTLLLLTLLTLLACSCQTVRPYERMYLNDSEMVLKLRQIEGYETNIHAYREGAAGANGGKAGGGCGCN